MQMNYFNEKPQYKYDDCGIRISYKCYHDNINHVKKE